MTRETVREQALLREIEGMRIASETRATIEQAKGVLMFVYQVDAERAFAILTRWSMQTQVKIRELAPALLEVCLGVETRGNAAARDAVLRAMAAFAGSAGPMLVREA